MSCRSYAILNAGDVVGLNDSQGSRVKPTMRGHQGQNSRDQMPGSTALRVDDRSDAERIPRPLKYLGGGGSRDCHRSLEV